MPATRFRSPTARPRKIGPGIVRQADPAHRRGRSSCAPPAAMDAVRKLVNVDKVNVVLGEYSSGRTLPTGQFTNENKVVHVSIGANSPTLRKVGPYFFNAIGLAELAGPAADHARAGRDRRQDARHAVPEQSLWRGRRDRDLRSRGQDGRQMRLEGALRGAEDRLPAGASPARRRPSPMPCSSSPMARTRH